jgi:hypothetical protein
MIHQAAEALALDLTRSWVIGDAPRDIEAGKAAGCRTILFTDSNLKVSPAALEKKNVEPDYICSTLAEAMDFIERNTERPPAAAPSQPEPAPAPSPPPPPPPPANGTAPRPMTSIEKLMARAAVQAGDNPSAITPPRPAPESPARPAAAAAPETSVQSEAPRVSTPAPSPVASTPKLESLALDILHELRRRHEQPQQDFSVSKLLAGITQVVVLALLFLAFLNRSSPILNSILLTALTFQAMTIALLIMQRQR